jgi:hypothetical protein
MKNYFYLNLKNNYFINIQLFALDKNGKYCYINNIRGQLKLVKQKETPKVLLQSE